MSFVHSEKANQAWHEEIRRSIWLWELWVRPRLPMLQSEALGQTISSCPGLSSPGPTHCNCWSCSEAAPCTNCAPSMLNLPYTGKLNPGKVWPLPRSAQRPHKNQEKWTEHIDFPYGEAMAHVHIIKNNLYPWVQDTLFQSAPSSRNPHLKAEDVSSLCYRKFRARRRGNKIWGLLKET